MSVGSHFWLLVSRKRTSTIFQSQPSFLLFTNLAFIALAALTYNMPTFVGTYSLSVDLFAANPAMILFLLFSYFETSQLFESKFVLTTGTVDNFWLFFHWIYMFGSIFKRPKSSFDILFLLWVQFIDSHWFDLWLFCVFLFLLLTCRSWV